MVEARGTKPVAQALGERLLVAEHDARHHTTATTVEAPRDRACERSAERVADAGESASPANHDPAVGVQDDVHALVAEPGSLVEAMLRRARQSDRCRCLEQAALRWRSPERKLEEDGFTEAQPAEAPHLGRNAEREAGPARRPSGYEHGALGRVHSRKEDTSIQCVEAGASPPPAGERAASEEKRGSQRLVRCGRREHDESHPDGCAEQRESGHVGAHQSDAERDDENMRRRRMRRARHGTTRSRSWSSRLGPMPDTASSSSIELKAPCFAR